MVTRLFILFPNFQKFILGTYRKYANNKQDLIQNLFFKEKI